MHYREGKHPRRRVADKIIEVGTFLASRSQRILQAWWFVESTTTSSLPPSPAWRGCRICGVVTICGLARTLDVHHWNDRRELTAY